MKRSLAAILGLFFAATGLTMLFDGPGWWASVPGVGDTGPFNPHFVADVGLAFLAAGLALGARAWRGQYWPAAMAGSAFVSFHALMHLRMIAIGMDAHAAVDLGLVVLPAALALYASLPAPDEHMPKLAARAMLNLMGRRYGYDMTYMTVMLRHAPNAFFKFMKIMEVARHREVTPKDAYYAAKLVGALAEDCGPCTQLVVNMAREAKVADREIEAVLRRDRSAMSPDAALGFAFAEAVAYHTADDESARDAVRAAWGEKGVTELTLALQVGRLFPMVKAGMGYAKECRRISLDGRNVDVIRHAA